jgi:GT2 family glycosyltransferase
MHVTVAICTWNRCALLRQTLEQLSQVPIPPGMRVEVLVVNNNCTDDTDAVIDDFQSRLPLRRVFEERAGVAHARNAALSSASGDYVAFLDDDALPGPGWLAALLAAARAFPAATAIGGVIEPWFLKRPDADLAEAFHWLRMGFCGLDHQREPGPLPPGLAVYGPNMALQKAALGTLRFNPVFGGTPASTMGGDEHELLRRVRAAGGTVVWWPSMRVRHAVPPSRMTLGYCLRFAADKGRERALLEVASPASHLLGAPRWLYRRWVATCVACVGSAALPNGIPVGPELLSGRVNVPGSRRVRTLVWRKELAFVGGMIRGYRQRSRRPVPPDRQPEGAETETAYP